MRKMDLLYRSELQLLKRDLHKSHSHPSAPMNAHPGLLMDSRSDGRMSLAAGYGAGRVDVPALVSHCTHKE